MTASAAALVSFQESSGLLRELAGVEVSAKQVERVAEALGAEIAADEQKSVEKTGPGAPTLYLGMDGTGVPMRPSEVAGRAGKQADGSAKTREAKLVTVWSAESRDAEGKPRRDPGSITYSAGIESAATRDTRPELSDFAARVQREATRRGFGEATRRVVLGDGSAWIWNTTSELFPDATQILDRFHAKEHLSTVGKILFGNPEAGQPWIEQRYDELDAGGLRSLVQALRPYAARGVVSLFGLFLLFAVAITSGSVFETSRNSVFDTYQRLDAADRSRAQTIVIDIDAESLRRIGQWPWPRDQLARLIDSVAGARVVGLDLLLIEPDRLSPPQWAGNRSDLTEAVRQALLELPNTDDALAASMGRVPVVLAVATDRVESTASAAPRRIIPVLESGHDSGAELARYGPLDWPLPLFANAAAGMGLVSALPERDGVMRIACSRNRRWGGDAQFRR